MGDLVSAIILASFAAVILRENLAQSREARADKRSMHDFAAVRTELERTR